MAHTTIAPGTKASKKQTPKTAALGKVLIAIDQEITAKPIRRFGMIWCCLPRKKLAAELRVSTKTIERCLASATIQYDVCIINEIKTTLLPRNDGKISEEYKYHLLANAMKSIFKKSTGRDIKPKDFGGLTELAKQWPDQFQLRIFQHLMANWGDFAAAYKLSAQVENDISGGGLPFAADWFMEFPNIRMMQAGWRVGLDVYEMHLQDQAANKLAKTFFK